MGGVGAAQLVGDPRSLARVVRNLLENGRRHARTALRVSLEETDRDVVLVVADDGPGIPLQDRERVFDRFVRLDEARTSDDGGAGLGLAITRAVVERHGGVIVVEDAPGGGASFRVSLPRRPPV
jgi:signal transduction histidine kinase